MPVDSDSEIASKVDPASQEKKPSMWTAEGKGEWATPQWPPRGGHREVPVVDKQEGEGPEDPSSSLSSRWHDWMPEKCISEEIPLRLQRFFSLVCTLVICPYI